MTDNLSPEHRLKTMRAVKSKNTGPERRLRAMLAGMKISGWRMNPPEVTGKPDVVFLREKLAIFVDGCFWHCCPECNRPLPVNNREYWVKKIQRNVARDRRYDAELKAQGWRVLRIWGHELKKRSDLKTVGLKIRRALRS